MLAAFVDETYPEDRSRFAACAVVADFGQYLDLSHSMTQLKKQTARDYGVSPHAEFHGHEIWHARGQWEALRGLKKARRKIFGRLFDAVHASGAKVIIEGVKEGDLTERRRTPLSAHDRAFSHLFERIHEQGQERNENVAVICDHVDPSLQQHSALSLYRQNGTYGFASTRLDRITGSLRYVDSTDQLALQAADMIAYFWNRRYTDRDKHGYPTLPHAGLWSRLGDAITQDRLWIP